MCWGGGVGVVVLCVTVSIDGDYWPRGGVSVV